MLIRIESGWSTVRPTGAWLAGFLACCSACSQGDPFASPDAAGVPPSDPDGADSDGGEPDATQPDGGPPVGATCPEGTRRGGAGRITDLKTPSGLLFNFLTPPGYRPTVGSPLLAVYSASGGDRNTIEPYMGLTVPALSRGFMVAYADHIDLYSLPWPTIRKMALELLTTITGDWCVDPSRIYLAGHSDGASTLNELVRVTAPPPAIAAVAPSASGTNHDYTIGLCPKETPFAAIVLHSKNDEVFPGAGRPVADYYIRCNQCNPTPTAARPDGCLVYEGCTNDATVQFCEGIESHHDFRTAMDGHILDFFLAHPRR